MYGSHHGAPAICTGNGTCDARVPHVCYKGLDVDSPWEVETHKHGDGGTFRVVQEAPTQKGFGIAVLERTYYTGRKGFDVVRMTPQRKFTSLHRGIRTEKEARAKANVEWSADKGYKPVEMQPICVGAELEI